MHGDEVGRAGFASPSAWQAAGNRWKAGAYGWDFQDILLGHCYARDSMAASGVPSQRLHFIDPDAGTWAHELAGQIVKTRAATDDELASALPRVASDPDVQALAEALAALPTATLDAVKAALGIA